MASKKNPAATRKKSGGKSGGKKHLVQPTEEPRYIEINKPQRDRRTLLVWVIVVALTAVLLFFWFLSLSQTIAQQANNLNLKQIQEEINAALNKFDTAKNLASSTPLLTPAELAELKNNVISEIKQTETDLWPAQTSALLGLDFRLPADWQLEENQNTLRLASYNLAGDIPDNFVLITLTAQNDGRKQSLFSWFSRNKIDLKEYSLDEKSLNSTSTDILHYTRTAPTADEIDRRVYWKTADKVYEIEIIGRGDETKIIPLNQTADEIINSLELIKK